MKIPGLGKIATFAVNRVVLPAIGRAIANSDGPTTKQSAADILAKAVEINAMRQWGSGRDSAGAVQGLVRNTLPQGVARGALNEQE